MADTYTSSNRFTKQQTGANANTWGTILNTVIDLVEDSMDAVTSVDVSSGDVTLSTANGAADEARNRVIKITGAPASARSITIPDQEKNYLISNLITTSVSVTIKNISGTGFAIPPIKQAIVYCDGASTRSIFVGIDALDTTLNLSDLTNASAARDNLGVAIGSDVQAYDDKLTSIAGLSPAANQIAYFTGTTSAGLLNLLDEDDMASDSASGVPTQQSVKAYVAASGVLLQKKTFTTATEQSSTTTIPADNTAPQSSEGVQVFSQSFTPVAGTSKILISGYINITESNGNFIAVALFVDSGSDAVAVNVCGGGVSGTGHGCHFSFIVDATDTTARTYKVRAGAGGGTFYINRSSTTNLYGTGLLISTMTIEEISV